MQKEYFNTIEVLTNMSMNLKLSAFEMQQAHGLLYMYVMMLRCYTDNKPKGLKSCVENISKNISFIKEMNIDLNIPFHTYHLFNTDMIPYITTV